jgi:phosphonate transport system substrate-binding protein
MPMLSRRTLMLAAGAMAYAPQGFAQAWKAQFPELVFAVAPSENASGVVDRFAPFVDYLSREIGTKVTLRVANDYAAVIEGQKAGNVHIAFYGPASFAKARMIGVNTDAFAIKIHGGGAKGYYSVFYVRADSPFKTIDDLKGHAMGLVDPNSTSGYNMPLFKLDKLGIKPGAFFSKMVITGSHENAVLALARGTVDVCANWWNADNDSNLTRMLTKGMVRDKAGNILTKQDFRIILTSDLIINSPLAMLTALPSDLKETIKAAFFNAPKKAPVEFARLSDGQDEPWQPISNADYDETIKLVRFVDRLRKS